MTISVSIFGITSEDAGVDEQGKYKCSSANVDILISKNVCSKLLTQGTVGARITWVHMDGPAYPLFVICVYIPDKYQTTQPCASDVIV